jgi:transcriptional regulator with XRE-family HTH domain
LTIEEAFGEAIRDLRKAKQISQEKLAEVSNLDRSFISLLECGRKQPSLITIFQLAEAFNLSASKILSLVEEKIKKVEYSETKTII